MKKSLIKLQALIIALAVVVSFGFTTVHSYSGNVGEHDMTVVLTGSNASSISIKALNCDGPEDHCDYDNARHSHISECCPLPTQAALPGLTGTADTPWSERAKNLLETVSAPPLRPPRVSA